MRHLILCVLLAASLAIAYNRRSLPLGNDEAAYQQIAKGATYNGLWPPLYPVLGSLVGFRIVSLLSLVFLIILLFRISPDPVPVYLVALCSVVFAFGFNSMSEMLFTFLVTLTIWLFIHTNNWWLALLAGLSAALCYQTRYIGIFLLPWMLIIAFLKTSKWKFLGFGFTATGVTLAIAANLWRYGLIAGERPPSRASIVGTIYSLGLAVWAVWLGDGPIFKHPSLALSILGLGALIWLLRISWPYGVAATCYLMAMIAIELRVDLDPIQRRYLLPVVPILIIFNTPKSKKWRIALVSISICLALAHAIRGRTA